MELRFIAGKNRFYRIPGPNVSLTSCFIRIYLITLTIFSQHVNKPITFISFTVLITFTIKKLLHIFNMFFQYYTYRPPSKRPHHLCKCSHSFTLNVFNLFTLPFFYLFFHSILLPISIHFNQTWISSYLYWGWWFFFSFIYKTNWWSIFIILI